MKGILSQPGLMVMRLFVIIATITPFVMSCDDIGDDRSTVPIASFTIVNSSLEEDGSWFSLNDSRVLLPIHGDFKNGEISVVSTSDNLKLVETETVHDNVIFVEYKADDVAGKTLDYQVSLDNQLVLDETIEIKGLTSVSDCSGAQLGDKFEVSEGGELLVDLLDNEVFCNIDVGSAGVRVTSISNTEGVHIAISSSSALLTYSPPDGFSGRAAFIYELCYGIVGEEDLWTDANVLDRCQYFYSALVTIDVVNDAAAF